MARKLTDSEIKKSLVWIVESLTTGLAKVNVQPGYCLEILIKCGVNTTEPSSFEYELTPTLTETRTLN